MSHQADVIGVSIHPCQSCGACCASFRVEFDAKETGVPAALCETSAHGKKVMKGTQVKHNPACTALNGRVGKFVACEIYNQRSSTCRNFQASYETGQKNPRCDEARAKHGLSPLRREDWIKHDEQSL